MKSQKPPSPGAARHTLLRFQCALIPEGEGLGVREDVDLSWRVNGDCFFYIGNATGASINT